MLKRFHLGGTRKQRPDNLIYTLQNNAMHDISVRVGRILSLLDKRPKSKAEINQFNLAEGVAIEKGHEMVSSFEKPRVSELGEDFDDIEVEIFVRSFQSEDVNYRITLNEMDQISKCSCSRMGKTLVVCKHMSLMNRIFGYEICFNTRVHQELPEEGFNQPTEETDRSELPQHSSNDAQRMLEQILDLDADYRIDLETLLRRAKKQRY